MVLRVNLAAVRAARVGRAWRTSLKNTTGSERLVRKLCRAAPIGPAFRWKSRLIGRSRSRSRARLKAKAARLNPSQGSSAVRVPRAMHGAPVRTAAIMIAAKAVRRTLAAPFTRTGIILGQDRRFNRNLRTGESGRRNRAMVYRLVVDEAARADEALSLIHI